MTIGPISPKPAALRWNAGGWFGAQIGATCWIAVCGALLLAQDARVAGLVLAIFLSANLVGTSMWFCRKRLSAYAGMQMLIVLVGAAGVATTFVIDRSGLWSVVQGVGGTVSKGQMYVLIPAMTAGLCALFWILNRTRQPRRR